MKNTGGIKMLVPAALVIISFLSTLAFAETNVTEITVYTDSSWKVFDSKKDGWTSINFDDSYWLAPIIGDSHSGWIGARGLKYPETPSSHPYFFRKTFELNGTEIMSGKLYYDTAPYVGYTTIYVNDNDIGKGTQNDITQYLKIGKNVIAAEDPDNDVFWLIAKIRVVTGLPSSTPTPVVTSTDTGIPTPIPSSVQTSSVSLTGEKTDVVLGEDILLKLSAVNLITKPKMHVQVIIIPPSGMSVTSSEFSKSGTNQFTANYELNPGDGKDVEVKIRPNQVGDFNVNGRIVYYFDDEKDKAEDHTLDLPIKVSGINPTMQPTSQPTTPGFALEIAIISILLMVLFIRKRC